MRVAKKDFHAEIQDTLAAMDSSKKIQEKTSSSSTPNGSPSGGSGSVSSECSCDPNVRYALDIQNFMAWEANSRSGKSSHFENIQRDTIEIGSWV